MGACDRRFLHRRISFSLLALTGFSGPWSLVGSLYLSLSSFYHPNF
jgi:hypothetical protein